MAKITRTYLTDLYGPVALVLIGYAAIAVFFIVTLHYDFLQPDSDAFGYWQDSLRWQQPFHRSHVPGYPLALALARGVLPGAVPPVVLMMGLNLAALVVSVVLMYRIIQISGVAEHYAAMGACLFGLWPFVGLVYSVYPLADMPAMVLLLAGLYALQRHRLLIAAVFLGLSLVTHKAMWPFVGLLAVAEVWYRRPSRRAVPALLLLLAPLGLLWLAGSSYHGAPTWLIASSLKTGIASQSTLPLLDGILGTLLSGSLKDVVKGILMLGFALLTAWLLYALYRIKPPFYPYGSTLAVTVLLLFVILNQHAIWAAMRFSPLLAAPLMWSIGHRYPSKKPRWLSATVVTLAIVLLLASQFVFSWYMARAV